MSKRIYVRYILMTAHGIRLGKREYEYHAPSHLDVPLHGTVVKIKTAPERIGGFAYVNPALVVAVCDDEPRPVSRQIVKYTGLTLDEFLLPSIKELIPQYDTTSE